MRCALTVFAVLLLASPGLAQTEADRAEALRDAAEALRGAIGTLEEAAATLEGAAGAGAEAAAEAPEAEGQGPEMADEAPEGDGQVTFLDPLDNTPLEIPAENVTAAVEHFHATAENPYAGDQAAIDEGETLYNRLCAACHLTDGTGRIGPNLVDDNFRYPRMDSAKGKFEIIYAGGAGAMQPFSQRISQDEILRVIAFLDALGAE